MALTIDLAGKNVLVTGASRGIGAAIAQGLMEAGARVALHFNKNEGLAEALLENDHTGSKAFQANLADSVATERLFDEVMLAFGRIDVLVNNAGMATKSPLEDPNWLLDWETTMAVNLRAAAQLSRRAVQHFQTQGGGCIIHISSRAAFRGDTPDYLAYGASKGGMVALHRGLARGFGKQNIKSFMIAPGFVRTDMAQDFMDLYGEDYALNDIALPSLTVPKDLSPLVVLLASGLSDHATGGTFDVNAGSYVH